MGIHHVKTSSVRADSTSTVVTNYETYIYIANTVARFGERALFKLREAREVQPLRYETEIHIAHTVVWRRGRHVSSCSCFGEKALLTILEARDEAGTRGTM